IIDILLENQQKDGSWKLSPSLNGKGATKNIGFGYGITGIVWFLLEYITHHPNSYVQNKIIKGLNWLLNRTSDLKDIANPSKFEKILTDVKIGDEKKGLILTFIKAYEVLRENSYKKIVEEALMIYPSYILKNNINQESGLAGLGEVYLEAWR